MYNKSISIVLAVYNGEKYLNKLIDSILAQIGVDIEEIIIVDDCSTDGSVAITEAYQTQNKHIKFISNDVNMGPILSFKKGAQLATGQYLAFADQDDIWKEDKLFLSVELITAIDDHKKPAVVFTDLEMIDEADQSLNTSFWNLYNINPQKNNFFTLLFGNIITGCTMVINKEMQAEFIDMPTGIIMHDHWVALIAASFGTWKFLNEKTVLYRVHSLSVTNKEKNTIGDTIKNFIKVMFTNDREFLNEKIRQASLFRSHYLNMLNANQLAQLDYFINLKDSSGFVRKLNSNYRFMLSKWVS